MNLFQKLQNRDFRIGLEKDTLKSYHGEEYDLHIAKGPYLPLKEEKQWLAHILSRDEAANFLRQETIEKLTDYLVEQPKYNHLTVKQTSQAAAEWNAVHLELRQLILDGKPCLLSYFTRNGAYFEKEQGFPVTLQYNIVKKQWNLIWVRGDEGEKVTTPLSLIKEVDRVEIECQTPSTTVETPKETVILRINPNFNQDIQRLFLSFSCFEKQLTKDEFGITIEVQYFSDEREYILLRIRQLGPHVKIISPENLVERMKETARRVLEVYQ